MTNMTFSFWYSVTLCTVQNGKQQRSKCQMSQLLPYSQSECLDGTHENLHPAGLNVWPYSEGIHFPAMLFPHHCKSVQRYSEWSQKTFPSLTHRTQVVYVWLTWKRRESSPLPDLKTWEILDSIIVNTWMSEGILFLHMADILLWYKGLDVKTCKVNREEQSGILCSLMYSYVKIAIHFEKFNPTIPLILFLVKAELVS